MNGCVVHMRRRRWRCYLRRSVVAVAFLGFALGVGWLGQRADDWLADR